MKRKNKNLASLTLASTMAVSMSWGPLAHAASTVGDYEAGSNDGWFDWIASNGGGDNGGNPGATPATDLPSSVYSNSPTGATLGSSSMRMASQTGYTQNFAYKTEWETDSEGNNVLADFLNNTEFSVNVTFVSTDWSAGTTYVNMGMAFNASGFGFGNLPANSNYIGPPTNDTGNTGFPGGWDPTNYPGTTTRTLTWNYSSILPGGSATTTISAGATYAELIMATNTNGNGFFYFDNARFTSAPVTTTWQAQQHPQGTSYNWGTISNFTPYSQSTQTGGMPSNPGDTVTFGTNIPAGITETIDLNETQDFQISVGTMIFNNPASSYLIDQGTAGTLTLNGNTINPSSSTPTPGLSTIADLSGNHTISAPVALATNTTASITSGSIFTISGNVGGAGGLTVGATTYTNGTGTLALSGLNTYSGGTTVTSGVLEILPTIPVSATGSALAKGAVTLSGSGKLQLATNVTLGSQSTSPAAPTSNVNITSLAITGNGTLDINNNHLIINYGAGSDPIASIAAWITSGFNGGGANAWTGTGITSTAAQANAGSYGIGYADSADPGNPAGLSSGQIEIMYTLLGDANLDGKVNGSDFAILATNFNKAVSGWDAGDFNYDGKDNGADFTDLAANFNKGASTAADVAALDSFAAANGLLTSVPEPASAGLFLLAGAGILARRKRG